MEDMGAKKVKCSRIAGNSNRKLSFFGLLKKLCIPEHLAFRQIGNRDQLHQYWLG